MLMVVARRVRGLPSTRSPARLPVPVPVPQRVVVIVALAAPQANMLVPTYVGVCSSHSNSVASVDEPPGHCRWGVDWFHYIKKLK